MVQGNRIHHGGRRGSSQPHGFSPQEAESNDSWCSVHRDLSRGISEWLIWVIPLRKSRFYIENLAFQPEALTAFISIKPKAYQVSLGPEDPHQGGSSVPR